MLVIKNASELITCRPKNLGPKIGEDFGNCSVIRNGAVIIKGEKIAALGKTREITKKLKLTKKDIIIDASGKIVMPGFVDCHTHAVFDGSRAEEYQLKLNGLSYEALHKQKGGIYLTVEATKKASEKKLFLKAASTLRKMLERGTTTVEIKSGYGLDCKDELKILRVIKQLNKIQPQDVVSTFLAHAIPLKYQHRRKQYVREITNRILPEVASKNLAEYCDVFCDPLAFNPSESLEIFDKAKQLGLKLRVHAEQTAHFGGARLAAEVKAVSSDHCDFMTKKDIEKLKKTNTTAVLVPGVFFHLREWRKKSRLQKITKEIKEAKLPLALATDYNPGSSPIFSMKIVMDLALRFLGLNYEECLNAATINAAYALNRGDSIGSIEEGKQADIIIADSPTLKDFLHQIGDGQIQHVIKKGREYELGE